ncbi:MAG: phosphomannose isomerase type II C-terminal cupin domain [Paracoccaceae bacterium]
MNIPTRDTRSLWRLGTAPARSDRHAWGFATSLARSDRFRVRHLVIRPGRRLDVQSHYHRAEHWLVASGSGRATVGGRIVDLFEAQSLDIPVAMTHLIENHGKVDLHLIEVQTGTYLGEDDIIADV